MSTWLTESEYRQSGAIASGVSLNVAFLQEIKEDHIELKQRLKNAEAGFAKRPWIDSRTAYELLFKLQDSLETHFALEEFYGYFQVDRVVSEWELDETSEQTHADRLRNEHHFLFLQINCLVELTEQIVYKETGLAMQDIAIEFERFRVNLLKHEQAEMELMLRICNGSKTDSSRS